MLLVKAGAPVDAFIDKLVPLLDKGDIIIDGGNSEYQDSRYVSRKNQKVSENLLQQVCCKKQQKKFLTSYWFVE